MTPLERRLREDLHELADVPAPDGSADRALAGARKVRRRRVVLAGASSMALVVLIAIPVLTGIPAGGWHLPFGAADGGTPCETATDEADPPAGVPASGHPRFVRVVLGKLPPRDDYSLQSAYGICIHPGAPPGQRPSGYTVINLGPNREHGHLTVTIYYEKQPLTCATAPMPPGELLFCEEATATTPLVLGTRVSSAHDFTVTAVYSDARAVSIGAHRTPLDVAAVRAVVTDPELIELLP